MISLLVGNIASGKSTFSSLAALHGSIIVNDDDIVNMIHGGNYTLYSEHLKPLYKSIENHIVGISIALGKNVVIDRPNVTRLSRQRYIGLAASLDVPVNAIVFPFSHPTEHADRRFYSDNRNKTLRSWQETANRLSMTYEPISEDEGFTKIINVVDLDNISEIIGKL